MNFLSQQADKIKRGWDAILDNYIGGRVSKRAATQVVENEENRLLLQLLVAQREGDEVAESQVILAPPVSDARIVTVANGADPVPNTNQDLVESQVNLTPE